MAMSTLRNADFENQVASMNTSNMALQLMNHKMIQDERYKQSGMGFMTRYEDDEDEENLYDVDSIHIDIDTNDKIHTGFPLSTDPPPYNLDQSNTLLAPIYIASDRVEDNMSQPKTDTEILSKIANMGLQQYVNFDGVSSLIFGQKGYTYEDVILLPSGYIDFDKNDINLDSHFSRNIKLHTPIVSSPMDTVTGEKMAIHMALNGGLGIIHCNNTPEEQSKMVKKVKRFTNGLISDPITVEPGDSIQDVLDMIAKNDYTYSNYPVVKNDILCGLLSKRDIDLARKISLQDHKPLSSIKVVSVMRNNGEKLIIFDLNPNGDDEKNMDDLMDKIDKRITNERLSVLPITQNNKLKYIACRKDINNLAQYPNASLSNKKQLLVGGAISTGIGYQDRVKLLAEANVDVIVIDSSQGFSKYQIEAIRFIKNKYPHIDVVGGNVATYTQACALAYAGVDGIRCGMGSGSICITQDVTGVGGSSISSIARVFKAVNSKSVLEFTGLPPIPITADGGIKSSGCIVKALAVGASCIMLGSLLAGTDETPGKVEYYKGKPVKTYRGMGSMDAMKKGSADRYIGNNTVAQGVSGKVEIKGPVKDKLSQLVGGVKSGLQNIGIISIEKIPYAIKEKLIRWEVRNPGAIAEGKVHGLLQYEV